MTQKPAWATALHRIRNFTPDALVVSLGVDSFAGDRADWFELQSSNYLAIEHWIWTLNRPIHIIMGYSGR